MTNQFGFLNNSRELKIQLVIGAILACNLNIVNYEEFKESHEAGNSVKFETQEFR